MDFYLLNLRKQGLREENCCVMPNLASRPAGVNMQREEQIDQADFRHSIPGHRETKHILFFHNN